MDTTAGFDTCKKFEPCSVVPAHEQNETLHLIECYPEHEPRKDDPHYHFFNAARKRLKDAGKLICWINNKDCQGGIELHHDKVEYALANGIDIEKFCETYPEFGPMTEEDFMEWIEEDGNLLPICVAHHRGSLGIHHIPYPSWRPQKYWKSALPVPAHVVQGKAKDCEDV